MKKKFLLLFLFCSTLVLALIGLSTEKTQASIWGDYPWAEMGEIPGVPRTERVRCTKITDDIYYDVGGNVRDRITTPQVWEGTATFCDGAYVVVSSSCMPSNPC